MKFLFGSLVFAASLSLGLLSVEAGGPAASASPKNRALDHTQTKPQQNLQRLSRQASPQGLSRTPGRGKSAGGASQRLARRPQGKHAPHGAPASTHADAQRVGPRVSAHDAPRQAMTRSLSKRLSQIDKLRDKALESGDLGMLEMADRLELQARRKFEEMTARMDQRQAQGKPGVGPPVRLAEVEPTPDPTHPPGDLLEDPTTALDPPTSDAPPTDGAAEPLPETPSSDDSEVSTQSSAA